MADPFLRDSVVVTPEQGLAERPEHARRQPGPGDAPPTLVLCHAPVLLDAVVAALGAGEAAFGVGPARLFVSDGVGACWPGVGAPAAALVLEKCIAAGTRRVLSLGFAGGIAPDARAGEVVEVTGAKPGDGVTAHYAVPGYEPAPDVALVALLRKACAPARAGRVWTTDAPYRETRSAVERHRARGVVAVDMETGAVLTVAAYRGVPAAAVLIVTDVLGKTGWTPCAPRVVEPIVRRVAAAIAGVSRSPMRGTRKAGSARAARTS